jgi:hypothetical protein
VAKNSSFILPAGTILDGGVDAMKNPVSYSTLEDISLSPAQITDVYTIALIDQPDGSQRIFNTRINDAGTVQKDKSGIVQSWETFGGADMPQTMEVKPAIAISSPMLLLREGKRNLTVTLNFVTAIDREKLLQNPKYYLTTKNGWVAVTDISITQPDDEKQAGFVFSLKTTDPAIEPFLKNPDGFKSDWPILKIEFGSVDLSSPPILSKLVIDVRVLGMRTLQLFNDFGPLTKPPYQLLGPAPLVNNNFIFGSDEIFSKPLGELRMQLDWDPLPADFSDYYNEYNFYLTGHRCPKNPDVFQRILAWFNRIVRCCWNWITNLFSDKKDVVKNRHLPPFRTNSFTVNFSALENKLWYPLTVFKAEPFPIPNVDLSWQSYTSTNPDTHRKCKCWWGCKSNCACEKKEDQLFTINSKTCNTISGSYFVRDPAVPITPDPALQLSPLQYNGQNASGFIKMSLAGPAHGFGSDIYAGVVSKMALYNGWVLLNNSDSCSKPVFRNQANPPFVPKLSGFKVDYQAKTEYDLDPGRRSQYPLEYILYSSYKNYRIYDSSVQPALPLYNYIIAPPVDDQKPVVPLYQPFAAKGYLFLGIEDIVPSKEMNFYFGLTGKNVQDESVKSPEFYYLSANGWKLLPVLSEATNSFNCSGIVSVYIPADIVKDSLFATTEKFWITVAVCSKLYLYAQTFFVKTNGILAERSGPSYFLPGILPFVKAGTINKFRKPIPQVPVVVQPFPSFGGIAAENTAMLYRRVSHRIRTKDRAVNEGDYHRLIRLRFNDIYFSKTVCKVIKNGFSGYSKTIIVYLVKVVTDSKAPGAFLPLVAACQAKTIQEFLAERTPGFFEIRVSNFRLIFVQVIASVSIKPGFEFISVQQKIVNSLNFFLSPWISGTGKQKGIEEPLSYLQLAAVISEVEGVAAVDSVLFVVKSPEDDNTKKLGGPAVQYKLNFFSPEGYLMVSGLNHKINLVNAKE